MSLIHSNNMVVVNKILTCNVSGYWMHIVKQTGWIST